MEVTSGPLDDQGSKNVRNSLHWCTISTKTGLTLGALHASASCSSAPQRVRNRKLYISRWVKEGWGGRGDGGGTAVTQLNLAQSVGAVVPRR